MNREVVKLHNTPAARIKRLNARIPVALEREDETIAKRLRKPRIDPFDGLELLFDHLDRRLSYMTGLTACQKGCAYCCYSQVALSRLEADYIALKTGRKASSALNRKMISEVYCDPKRPCPFLGRTDNVCTIYPYRPVLCRTHVSIDLDNKNCQF